MRPDAVEGSRPNLGRRPDPQTSDSTLKAVTPNSVKMAPAAEPTGLTTTVNKLEESSSAKIQTRGNTVALDRPDMSAYHRPIRSTRNSNPKYVDAVTWSASAIELADINRFISQARLDMGDSSSGPA